MTVRDAPIIENLEQDVEDIRVCLLDLVQQQHREDHRGKLGALVFGNREELARLEAIMHPAVAQRRTAFLAENSDAPIIVFDIPLLFEKGGAGGVDRVVVVSAPHAVQRERVLAREGMTEEKFEQILALQTPDSDKRARADHVIDTGQSLAETEAEVTELIALLKSERPSPA